MQRKHLHIYTATFEVDPNQLTPKVGLLGKEEFSILKDLKKSGTLYEVLGMRDLFAFIHDLLNFSLRST